jgi:hypothetical protein
MQNSTGLTHSALGNCVSVASVAIYGSFAALFITKVKNILKLAHYRKKYLPGRFVTNCVTWLYEKC